MEERDPITNAVIGAAIDVHREMGPGLLESVYQECLAEEFRQRRMDVLSQYPVALSYKGLKLKDGLIMDFYIPGQLVIELKAVERIIPVHEAQLLSYMRLTKSKVGLLLNFNVPVLKDGIKRMVL